ncbi:MAG: 4Fe-4S binding protein, partial [Sphaerochaetaceae bacterium]|nr:4Fe-4S binding protein [Sphaerochaetaceae bacterium]
TKMIKETSPNIPVMVKLAVENCDTLTAIRGAVANGADAVGPTARWKAFYFDLDWKRTQARPGAGYGGTQATPLVCYTVAEARSKGITVPMFAGGGVFSYDQALRLIMAGSDMVQLGALACSGGATACANLMKQFESWMDKNGYPDIKSLKGDALKLFNMDSDFAKKRTTLMGDAYKAVKVDQEKCIGCGRCYDVCWHDAINIQDKKAIKGDKCIGCGYCFQVCPVKALDIDQGSVLASAWSN